MTALQITERDYRCLDVMETAIRREIATGVPRYAKVDCFNEAEARWYEKQLIARGLEGRFFVTWLTFERITR